MTQFILDKSTWSIFISLLCSTGLLMDRSILLWATGIRLTGQPFSQASFPSLYSFPKYLQAISVRHSWIKCVWLTYLICSLFASPVFTWLPSSLLKLITLITGSQISFRIMKQSTTKISAFSQPSCFLFFPHKYLPFTIICPPHVLIYLDYLFFSSFKWLACWKLFCASAQFPVFQNSYVTPSCLAF